MKLLKKHLILLMVLIATPLISKAQESSKNDKTFALNYYQETLDKLSKNVNGLSEAQLHFKASDSTWSISQCLEHIIKTEPMIFGMIKGYMEQPQNPERRKDLKVTDEDIMAMVTDRSTKYKAPEILKGEGKYNDTETALNDLKNQRADILAFIENTPVDELRNRVNDSPAGATDAYQSLLFLAGHTVRHTLQIEEIKADANFPKN
uniref:DinB family protein n=1 Tax=Gelidibacter sp. TaxID=2018083 RepID=UPI00404B52CB